MKPQVSEHLAHFVPDGVVLPTAHIQRNRSIRGEVVQQGSTDILMHDKAALVRGKRENIRAMKMPRNVLPQRRIKETFIANFSLG